MERHRQMSVAFLALLAMSMAAGAGAAVAAQASAVRAPVQPRVVSEPVRHDTDDPAIWVDPADPARTLIVGTDKDIDGALYVFGLDGRIKQERVVRGLLRPNNVDIARGEEQRFKIYVQHGRYLTNTRTRVFAERANGRADIGILQE